MADDFDRASELEELQREDALKKTRANAAEIPKGEAGECSYCGYHKERLVRGVCAGCRDEFNLP